MKDPLVPLNESFNISLPCIRIENTKGNLVVYLNDVALGNYGLDSEIAYLSDIQSKVFEYITDSLLTFNKPQKKVSTPKISSKYKVGDLVEHPTFGIGKVKDIPGCDVNLVTICSVDFVGIGEKTLSLRHDQLTLKN